MFFKTFVSGVLAVNNYLLIDDASKEAVLIDCTEYNPEFEAVLKEHSAALKYILITHGHYDHILGINETKEHFPDAKVLIHSSDEELVQKMKEYMGIFGLFQADLQKIDETFGDDKELFIGSTPIKIITTPGHTQGGVCYLIEDKLFTGDTIFKEAVGRCDLPGGNFEQLKSNIENEIFTLDENIAIYPGHGPKSTVGYEKTHNKFL